MPVVLAIAICRMCIIPGFVAAMQGGWGSVQKRVFRGQCSDEGKCSDGEVMGHSSLKTEN